MEPATVNTLADAVECCNYTIKQRLNIVISVETDVFINLYNGMISRKTRRRRVR